MNSYIFNLIFNFGRGTFIESFGFYFAQYSIFVVVVLLLLAGLWQAYKGRRLAIFYFSAISAGVAGYLVSKIIRLIYATPRPFMQLNLVPSFEAYDIYSFPSGHTIFLASIAMFVLMKKQKLGLALLGVAFLTGLARIHAGVHWPSDILAGMGFGIIIGYAVFGVFRKLSMLRS